MRIPARRHYVETLRLGWPLIVAQLGQIVLGFADGAMVGAYGIDELAAASFCINLFSLPTTFLMGYSYGLTPLLAQAYARAQRREMGGLLRSGMRSNLAAAVLLTAVGVGGYYGLEMLDQPEHLLPLIRPYYLLTLASLPFVAIYYVLRQLADSMGRTNLSMLITLSGNALNVGLNMLLIFGAWGFPEWGLTGAGVATLLARVAMALAFMVLLYMHTPFRRVLLGYLRHRIARPAHRTIHRMSLQVGVQSGLEAALFSVAIIAVGWLGSTALAAHHIAVTLQTLGFMTYYGLGAATSVRISHAWAKGRIDDVRQAANAGYHIALAFAVCMSASMFALRIPLGQIFTHDSEAIQLASTLLLIGLAYQPVDALQVIYANALRGIGRTAPLALFSFVGYCAVGLPLVYSLGIGLQLETPGIWFGFLCGLAAAGIGFYRRFARLTGQIQREPRRSIKEK